jgi:hypothetical protein
MEQKSQKPRDLRKIAHAVNMAMTDSVINPIESVKKRRGLVVPSWKAEWQSGLSADVTVDTHSCDRKLAAATGPTSTREVSR